MVVQACNLSTQDPEVGGLGSTAKGINPHYPRGMVVDWSSHGPRGSMPLGGHNLVCSPPTQTPCGCGT